jgi:hypothetical protein
MHRNCLVPVAAYAVMLGTVAACEPTSGLGYCAGVGMAGIVAEVRTSAGAPAAVGATLIATDGAFADTVGPVVDVPTGWSDSLRIGWVETQQIRLTIDPLPGAPPVRGVAVAPRAVRFGYCGSAAQLAAAVDAAPGVDRGVRWTSSDTAVAAVEATGLVRVRSRGRAVVTATAVADSAARGHTEIVVDPVCS